MPTRETGPSNVLTVRPQQVCYIIAKARQYDVKVAPVVPDDGSNPTDTGEPEMGEDPVGRGHREMLEDRPGDPSYEELTGAIEALAEDEQIELVALVWLGRGDYTVDDWREAVRAARDRHNDRTAEYLAGIPLLGDYLEDALTQLGYSCEEFFFNRM